MSKETRVLLTGGHAGTTALAVIEEIKVRDDTKDWKLFWIGAKHAFEGKKLQTLESSTLPKLGVTSYSIITGRVQRKFTRYTIPSLLKIPVGFAGSLWFLLKIRPHVILSFGGYVAFPVVVVGWLLRIPVIIHEQTIAVWSANKASSPFAKKVALAREESMQFFPREKSVVVGNPVMKKMSNIKVKTKMGNPPVLFVTGGSRGSSPINNLIRNVLPRLVKEFQVYHQCGHLDYEEMREAKENLAEDLKLRYEVYANIDPSDMQYYWEKADIVISRAGANTVSEIVCAKKPALLIPLMFKTQDEQKRNALFAQKFGIARVGYQDELTSDRLMHEIEYLKAHWQEMVNSVKDKESPDIEAASKVVDLLKDYV